MQSRAFSIPRAFRTRRPPSQPLRFQAQLSARSVSLRHVSDNSPGFHRKKSGSGFTYLDAKGRPIRDPATLARIKSLVIPPAWTNVWISAAANAHLQATGFDIRRRKQYRYHPRFRQVRDENKYAKMIAFGKALPIIRRRISRDLKLPGLPREKVLAAVVKLLETTLIRVGNDEYAKSNNSFGLTTLHDEHVAIRGKSITFEFKGKSGILHQIDLTDPRLAKIVKSCQDLPGQELFQYLDDSGKVRDVTSTDVNQYLREITGQDFTAKDFRTWAGTVLAAMVIKDLANFNSQTQAKKNIVKAVEVVAARLGNTKAVCRKCYIHPVVLDSYLDGSLVKSLAKKTGAELRRSTRNMKAPEVMVLSLLHQKLSRRKS